MFSSKEWKPFIRFVLCIKIGVGPLDGSHNFTRINPCRWLVEITDNTRISDLSFVKLKEEKMKGGENFYFQKLCNMSCCEEMGVTLL